MSKGTILFIEPDDDIRKMLDIYFTGLGYQVVVVTTAHEGLSAVGKILPNSIVFELDLPDMDGYELWRRLRTTRHSRHIPIIFLTTRSQYNNRIGSIEVGADDYITKPFDIEEMKLRIQNQIRQPARERIINLVTGLPALNSIEEILRNELNRDSEWHYIDLKIENFESFVASYGIQAGDFLQKEFALLLIECLNLYGHQDDFIGQLDSDHFAFVSESEGWMTTLQNLMLRANTLLLRQYGNENRLGGVVMVNGQAVPLMRLTYGVCAASEHPKTIESHQIIQFAAEDRAKNYLEEGN